MNAPNRFLPYWLRSRTDAELQAELIELSERAECEGAARTPDSAVAAILLGQVNAIAREVVRRKAGGK
jgi:hypothetical protein